jgi:tetratricopeptide (TPR) repeat protein
MKHSYEQENGNSAADIEVALQLHRAGNLARAQDVYSQILSRHPHQPAVLHLAGLAGYQAGNLDLAADLIRKALRFAPDNPAFFESLANILRARGDVDEAMVCYQNALTLRPDSVEALFHLGRLHHDRGDLIQATLYYGKTIQFAPDFMEAYYNLGLVYASQSDSNKAILCYRKSLELRPEFAAAHNNLGRALLDTGRLKQAVECFQRAIRLKPDFAEPHYNLGDAYHRLKQPATAVEHFQRAVQIQPRMLEAYNNLGNVWQELGNLDAAIENYSQVVRLKPELAEGYYNLGSALRAQERFIEATEALQCALKLKPDYAEAYNNLGLSRKSLGDLNQAAALFSQALRIKPDLAEAHWNRSFTYLLQGNFDDGWKDYDWRFRLEKWTTIYPFRLSKPRWDGKPAPDQRILIHDEQGLGDTIQFVRYLPLARPLCGRLIFETRDSLIPLLRGFPGIDELIGRSADGIPAADFDLHMPLLRLPGLFRTTSKTIPSRVPYLFAPQEKIDLWKNRLAGDGLKVGLVWAGRPQHANDRNRSCLIAHFHRIIAIRPIQFVGLQKGRAAAQIDDLPLQLRFRNFGGELEDFTDTAGLLHNLDLVISVDTAVAHLAGALGKPVWVLLPFIPDWRWMMNRQDSPWYPTMKLFRQKRFGDWANVIETVTEELNKLLDGN